MEIHITRQLTDDLFTNPGPITIRRHRLPPMSTKNRRITIYLYIEDSLRSLIPNYNQRNSLIQSLLSAISDIHKAPEENHRVKITLSKLIGEELVHYPIIDLEITKDRQKRTSLLTKLLSGEI